MSHERMLLNTTVRYSRYNSRYQGAYKKIWNWAIGQRKCLYINKVAWLIVIIISIGFYGEVLEWITRDWRNLKDTETERECTGGLRTATLMWIKSIENCEKWKEGKEEKESFSQSPRPSPISRSMMVVFLPLRTELFVWELFSIVYVFFQR